MKSVFPYGKASVSADGLLSVCAVVPQCQYPPPTVLLSLSVVVPRPPPLEVDLFSSGRQICREKERQTDRKISIRPPVHSPNGHNHGRS